MSIANVPIKIKRARLDSFHIFTEIQLMSALEAYLFRLLA